MPPRVLDELSRTIGALEATIVIMQERSDRDRTTREDEHHQNQEAMGQMRQDVAKAISELRVELKGGIDKLAKEVHRNGNTWGLSRAKLWVVTTVGLITLWTLSRIAEAGVEWAVLHLFDLRWNL